MKKLISAVAIGLLCVCSVGTVRAVEDVTIAVDSNLSAWLHPWGGAYQGMSYDDVENALKVDQAWTGTAADSYVCGTVAGCNGWLGCGPAIDGAKYESIELDIKWDPASTLNAGLQIGFDHGYAGTYLTNWYSPPTDGAWHHLSIKIPGAATGIENFLAVGFYRWQPDGTTGKNTYWIKNVVVKAKVVPVPPPTLVAPEPVKAIGLWLGMHNGAGGDRNSVYTKVNEGGGNGVSWVGSATPQSPVTYAMTIAQYPDSSKYPGIQSHIFLSSDAASTTGAPEWNSTNAIFFQIVNRTDGSAAGTFMFKTNAAGSWGVNPQQIFGANTLAVIDSTRVAGTWSITFTTDTDARVITPDNTTTNFTFPAEAVPYFQHVFASFGIQANNDNYGGQYVVISRAAVENGPAPFDDSFRGLLANNLSLGVAGPPFAAQIIPAGSAWYAKWQLPSTSFNVQVSPNLINWTDGPTNFWKFDTYGWLPLTQVDLPGNGMNFFRMIRRVASRLQVLLPGEVNAPGTATGKTGTPDPQALGTPFDVTVIACDDTWHVAPSTDTVHITSTDASAYLPFDAALVNGSLTFSWNNPFWFNASGTWTITAADVTTNIVTSGTSTPITILP